MQLQNRTDEDMQPPSAARIAFHAPQNTFGQTLSSHLSERGLKIGEFAIRCGLTPTHLSRLLKDQHTPRYCTFEKMVEELAPLSDADRLDLYRKAGYPNLSDDAQAEPEERPQQTPTADTGPGRTTPEDARVRISGKMFGNLNGNFSGSFRCTILLQTPGRIRRSARKGRAEID